MRYNMSEPVKDSELIVVDGKIYPYVSKASPVVMESLVRHAKGDYIVGITATASGFFGNQGRAIPGIRLTIPGLQKHLATIDVDGHRVFNIEMESSILFHLAWQMRYMSGTICPIIANRVTGQFLNKADYNAAIERCIQTGLDAMVELCS